MSKARKIAPTDDWTKPTPVRARASAPAFFSRIGDGTSKLRRALKIKNRILGTTGRGKDGRYVEVHYLD